MIYALACRCHSAEPLIRRILSTCHYPDPLKMPIIKGKEACLDFVSQLPENLQVGALKQFIERSGSWSVLLGVKDGVYRWANLSDHGPQGLLDAEVIVENFFEEEND